MLPVSPIWLLLVLIIVIALLGGGHFTPAWRDGPYAPWGWSLGGLVVSIILVLLLVRLL